MYNTNQQIKSDMTKNQFLFLIALFLTLLSSPTFAQKKVLTDEEEVSEMVTKEIDAEFHSENFLKKKNKKFKDISGTVTIDVGVIQNGKVSTFFKVDSDIVNADFINFLSDYILEHKFYFKLQKQQRYKIRYTITF